MYYTKANTTNGTQSVFSLMEVNIVSHTGIYELRNSMCKSYMTFINMHSKVMEASRY